MNYPSKILENAVNAIATLPGIGKKTALRLALHLIQDKNDKAVTISAALFSLKDQIKHCSDCHVISDDSKCRICSNPSRENKTLCIVENVRDMMAIEDTNIYQGKYHILGGLISPLDGVGASDLNIESLINRIESEKIEELIMAISPNIDGDTTSFYISKKLAGFSIKITSIARGVAFGGELEYADEFTLGRSISGRLPYNLGS
jgi:recombination protein RecR